MIGSGLGGLAAAIRLRARGHEVLVLEAMDQPGGRAAVFEQDGFSFDAGPTVVTASHLFDELFALVGRERRDYVQFVPVDPFYRVLFPDGSRFDYRRRRAADPGADRAILAARRRRLPPAGGPGAADLRHRLHGAGRQAFDRFTDMLKIVPDLARLGCWRSMYEWVSASIHDERLRQVFTFQPLLIGGNPFRAPAIYALIHWLERKWGVEFAVGGTTAIVKAMVRLLGELGVEVRVSTPVAEIEVEGGRATAVRTRRASGSPARRWSSNADPATVYTKLVAARHRRWNSDFLISARNCRWGCSSVTSGPIAPGPSWRTTRSSSGRGTASCSRTSSSARCWPTTSRCTCTRRRATDPNLAPPGCEAFYVLSPVPNTQAEGLDWDPRGEAYSSKIVDFLERAARAGSARAHRHPQARDAALLRDRAALVRRGGVRPEPRLTQSAYFRYHNASEDVRGLYFVGARHPPGRGHAGGAVPRPRCSSWVMPGPGRKGHVASEHAGSETLSYDRVQVVAESRATLARQRAHVRPGGLVLAGGAARRGGGGVRVLPPGRRRGRPGAGAGRRAGGGRRRSRPSWRARRRPGRWSPATATCWPAGACRCRWPTS